MGNKAKQKNFVTRNLLQDTLQFSDDELEAMRNHVMPQQQQMLLRDKRPLPSPQSFSSDLMWQMSFYLFGPVVCVVLGQLNSVTPAVSVITLIAILVGIPILFMFMTREIAAISRDINNKRIASVEGRIQLQVGQRNSYWLNVDGLSLRLDEVSFTAFRNGDPYMIYYAPESKIVLAAEWIDDAQYDQIFED